MDNNIKRPNSGTRRPSLSPMSAEDKLKKSMRGLSYTGSGLGTVGTSSQRPLNKQAEQRKKVGGVVLDVDTIQDANKTKFETKTRRNNVIILVLSLLFIMSLVYLLVAIISFNQAKGERNLTYSTMGEVKSTWIIDGGTETKFFVPNGVALGAAIENIPASLNIESSVPVVVEIEIIVKHNGERIIIEGLWEKSDDFEPYENMPNKYKYKHDFTSGTIFVCNGIQFGEEVPATINSENITIEIIAIVNAKI
jgi:hypothetical protein